MIDEKPWYLSKTIWGSLVAVSAALLSAFGFEIETDAQGKIAEAMVELVGACGALFAIFGRFSATEIIS